MKKIIICADGTGNTQEKMENGKPCPTHVARVARALHTEDADGTPQIIFYEAGVGTQTGLKLRGGGLGRGVWANILHCYRFLVHNYAPGDLIYLFGFSRGAFIARSLAGLIRNSGLLKRGRENCEREALELYRDYAEETGPDSDECVEFREHHSHEVEIEFIGVWDTVGSLGLSFLSGRFEQWKELNYAFHDVSLSRRVKRAYHALAVHERRTKFLPTLWKLPESPAPGQILEQVWFAGVHSDVGGGYADHALGDCSLEWMVEKAKGVGLVFGMEDSVPDFGPRPLGTMHDSLSTGFRILETICLHPHGTQRSYTGPGEPTCESLHESVRLRYEHDKAKLGEQAFVELWPPDFRRVLDTAARP